MPKRRRVAARSLARWDTSLIRRISSLSVFVLGLVTILAGCAAKPVMVPPAPSSTLAADAPASWWYIRFRFRWPEDEEPLWYPDLLLADRAIGPALEAERGAIELWRFHRRAARDEAGRRFSFIFRATPATAERINARISADPWVTRLQRRGVIEAVAFDDPHQPTRLNVAATSDPNWSPEMQTAWPHFIQGVSQLWLELIREIDKQGNWPKEPMARYAAIEKAINAMWHNEGGHALLHHLSAVFGYRDLLVTRREVMRF